VASPNPNPNPNQVAEEQAVARWLLKRCLRSGMELAARDRDLTLTLTLAL
jgi:hypothetical protein